jgi:hypothetical protein
MYRNQFIYEILIKGKPITEYSQGGEIFVEGRHGSEFELFFKNNSNNRVLFLPSVDGLSVFDGQPAGVESKGYIVNGWSSIVVPGWTLDNSNVAKFTFAAQEQSYSSQSGQGTANVGVVGAMVFEEIKPVYQQPIYATSTMRALSPFDIARHYSGNSTLGGGPVGGATRGIAPSGVSASADFSVNIDSVSKSHAGVSTASLNTMSVGSSKHEDYYMSNSIAGGGSSVETLSDAKLGTGFGQQAEFKTKTVDFNKGALLATLAIYYDSKRNLERRGIQVVRGEPIRRVPSTPNPFPANPAPGCVLPVGWQGVTQLDTLLSALTEQQKTVMKTLLQGVDESQLKSKYAEFLPAVMKI